MSHAGSPVDRGEEEIQARSSGAFVDQLPGWLRACLLQAPSPYPGSARRSLYVAVEDGTKLAVDIFLSKDAKPDERFPALLVATRYWRGRAGDGIQKNMRHWIARGFVVVVADVRGTGASFGQWYLPYLSQEVADVGYLANWITQQPWSDGSVATTGQSYTGTTALTAPAYGAPAIKAVVSRFSDFDQFTDLNFPGGLVLEQLLRDWGLFVRELDLNRSGNDRVRPVDGPNGKVELHAAIEEHKANPWSLDQAAYQITYKDELLNQFGGVPIDEAGTFNHRERIEAAGAPIMGWGSWLDAGVAQGMVNRFLNWAVPQLSIIGAWTHGASRNADPFDHAGGPVFPSVEDQERLYAGFIEPYVRGDHPPFENLLIYYTMGEGCWKSTRHWPILGMEQINLFLARDGTLSKAQPPGESFDRYPVDFEVSTGRSNRWTAQAAGGPEIDYGDRAEIDLRLKTYTTEPLAEDTEVTGQPVISLSLRSNQRDGNILVYLEDVAPDGRVTYVTEGHLRLLHRRTIDGEGSYSTTYPARSFKREHAQEMKPGEVVRLEFQLLPVSILFRAGHRIRIAIAGADDGIFLRVPPAARGATILDICLGGKDASFIRLPTIPRVEIEGAA